MKSTQFEEVLDIETAEKLMTQIRMNRREQFGTLNNYLNQLGEVIECYIREYKAEVNNCRIISYKQMKIITEHFGDFLYCLTFTTSAFECFKKSGDCKIKAEIVDAYIESSLYADIEFRASITANILDRCYNE